MESTTHGPGAIVPLDDTVEVAAVSCPVAGRRALARVLDALLGSVAGDRVVVVAAPGLLADAERIVADAGLRDVAVIGCDHPSTRMRCVARGLEWLAVESNSPILVHDHRSPLASVSVGRVLAAFAAGHDVVVPALPVTDTVKETDRSGAVLQTVDRQSLRTVQYPRGYRSGILGTLLDGADEFAAAVAGGVAIEMVVGDADAVPAALPDDAALLEAILAARPA